MLSAASKETTFAMTERIANIVTIGNGTSGAWYCIGVNGIPIAILRIKETARKTESPCSRTVIMEQMTLRRYWLA